MDTMWSVLLNVDGFTVKVPKLWDNDEHEVFDVPSSQDEQKPREGIATPLLRLSTSLSREGASAHGAALAIAQRGKLAPSFLLSCQS